jgi:predicted adenylyl cyclase CyaB
MNQISSPLSRNIELKARCPDLAAASAALASLSVHDVGVQQQIDTYFASHHGRLKLREIVGVRAELIWYQRSDEARSRQSDYYVVPVPDPQKLKAALTAALGVRQQVRKRRHVLLWHNVRIHLDDVEGLGTFVEFEAVMSAEDDEVTGHARLAELCQLMAISPGDRLASSYVDLK